MSLLGVSLPFLQGRARSCSEGAAMRYLSVFLAIALCALPVWPGPIQPPAAGSEARWRGARGQQDVPEQQQKPPDYRIAVTVPLVNIDAVVTDEDGNYVTGLAKENFRVSEDGVRQTVTNFSATQTPMTVVMLVEASRLGSGWFLTNATNWGAAFLRRLEPADWIALSSFALRPKVEVDFTHSQPEIEQALTSLIASATFTDSNLYDALVDTLDRLDHVKGKKSILLLASGIDTFSRSSLDDVLKRLRESDASIYCIGVGEQLFQAEESSGATGSVGRLNYYQAKNQLQTFARMTGGRAWFPMFNGEISGITADIAARLRNQYSLGYVSSNKNRDAKYRKIKVEIVAPDGRPLTVTDQKGKKRKLVVSARQGYVALGD